MHPALVDTTHRPWPLPERPWSLSMRWEHLLFLHWPVPAAHLRAVLPEELELETFDGAAWLGIVPFVMAATRFRLLPPLPTAHQFPECNLRTYVRAGARSGVWFFSLDAGSRLAVAGARLGFGLPYFRARMRARSTAGQVDYSSTRTDRRGPPARFAGRWRPAGVARPAAAGSLEHFLVERYCLFARRRGRLMVADVAHPPWQLSPVGFELEANDMTRICGLELTGPPASALAAAPLDVVAWSPVGWPPAT